MELSLSKEQSKAIKVIADNINKYHSGLINYNELSTMNDRLDTSIKGSYNKEGKQFIGYDYKEQEWIKFDFHPADMGSGERYFHISFHIDVLSRDFDSI